MILLKRQPPENNMYWQYTSPTVSIVSIMLIAATGFFFGSGAFGLGILFYAFSCLSVGANLSANRYPASIRWAKELGQDNEH